MLDHPNRLDSYVGRRFRDEVEATSNHDDVKRIMRKRLSKALAQLSSPEARAYWSSLNATYKKSAHYTFSGTQFNHTGFVSAIFCYQH